MTYHSVYHLGQPDDHAKDTSCEPSIAQKFISQKQIPSFQSTGDAGGTSPLQMKSGLFCSLHGAA